MTNCLFWVMCLCGHEWIIRKYRMVSKWETHKIGRVKGALVGMLKGICIFILSPYETPPTST